MCFFMLGGFEVHVSHLNLSGLLELRTELLEHSTEHALWARLTFGYSVVWCCFHFETSRLILA